MPLHLLGKKSWNVYNAENVARVRRDEASAAAAELGEEQRMQEEDAARRTAILRGEDPPPIHESTGTGADEPQVGRDRDRWDRKERKRLQRRRGEDDTDRDIRLAGENAAASADASKRLQQASAEAAGDFSITDNRGHIQLFRDPETKTGSRRKTHSAAKPLAETESATGIRLGGLGSAPQSNEDAWYAKTIQRPRVEAKDAFGRPDPKRVERNEKRTMSNDPMAVMRAAQGQLKRAEQDRGRWRETQMAELVPIKKEDHACSERRRRHRHHDRREEESRRRKRARTRLETHDGLEGFALDAK